MRGRKPKPTAVKRANGNPGQRPLNDREPQPRPGAPDRPSRLSGLAVEAWEWLCGMLDDMGILAQSDVAIMALYCDAWADFWAAHDQVEEEGYTLTGVQGGSYINPAYNVKSACRKELAKHAAELGLSPTSRTRIHATPKGQESDGKARFFGVVG